MISEHLKDIDPYGEENWDDSKGKVTLRVVIPYDYPNMIKCPKCGGRMHDGTGTGWKFCNDCNLMI
jgi:hypothetical protein